MREFEEYLRCGVLEHGLVHLACSRCGHDIVVGFSCKRRGFCPSCLGRRMSPPLAQERLSMHPDGRVKVSFKAAWKDGTHAVVLDPLDFISRLCALIPPPRFHMLRYHGVLAARATA